MTPTMNIAQASAASGVTPKMIRHYEIMGLVQPTRRGNNYRAFSAGDVERLRIARLARMLNYALPEIRELLVLLEVPDDPHPDPARAQARAAEMLRLDAAQNAARILTRLLQKGAQAHG